jgi:hypothetical protein
MGTVGVPASTRDLAASRINAACSMLLMKLKMVAGELLAREYTAASSIGFSVLVKKIALTRRAITENWKWARCDKGWIL